MAKPRNRRARNRSQVQQQITVWSNRVKEGLADIDNLIRSLQRARTKVNNSAKKHEYYVKRLAALDAERTAASAETVRRVRRQIFIVPSESGK